MLFSREILTELGDKDATAAGGSNEEDEDIQVMGSGSTNPNLKCPITTALLEDPVKNQVCGHVYSQKAMEAMLQNRGRTKCPVPGCTNTQVTNSQLVPDVQMDTLVRRERRRLEKAKEQQASQAQMVDSDEEEED